MGWPRTKRLSPRCLTRSHFLGAKSTAPSFPPLAGGSLAWSGHMGLPAPFPHGVCVYVLYMLYCCPRGQRRFSNYSLSCPNSQEPNWGSPISFSPPDRPAKFPHGPIRPPTDLIIVAGSATADCRCEPCRLVVASSQSPSL